MDRPDMTEQYQQMARINHLSWWERELPTEEEMTEGRKTLALNGNKANTRTKNSQTLGLAIGILQIDYGRMYERILLKTIR